MCCYVSGLKVGEEGLWVLADLSWALVVREMDGVCLHFFLSRCGSRMVFEVFIDLPSFTTLRGFIAWKWQEGPARTDSMIYSSNRLGQGTAQ